MECSIIFTSRKFTSVPNSVVLYGADRINWYDTCYMTWIIIFLTTVEKIVNELLSLYYTIIWRSFICFFADLGEVMLNTQDTMSMKWCIHSPPCPWQTVWFRSLSVFCLKHLSISAERLVSYRSSENYCTVNLL